MIIRGVICQSLARWLLPTDATIHRYDTGRTSPRGRLASLFCCPMRFDGIESMEAYLQFRLLLSVSSGQCSTVHQTHPFGTIRLLLPGSTRTAATLQQRATYNSIMFASHFDEEAYFFPSLGRPQPGQVTCIG